MAKGKASSAGIAKKQQNKQADELLKRTHFSKSEAEYLMTIFNKMTTNGKLSKSKFRDFLHTTFNLTDDGLLDRIFRCFDADNDGFMIVDEFLLSMSIFLRGTLEERIDFCFKVYDLNGDGYIAKEEVFTLLKNSLIRQTSEEDSDDSIKDLIEIVMKKMIGSAGKDVTKIDKKDYRQCVLDDNLLLEALGQCLPDPKYRNAFLEQFTNANAPDSYE